MNNPIPADALVKIEQEKTKRSVVTIVIIVISIFMVIGCCCGSAIVMSYMSEGSTYDYTDDYGI